MRIGQVARLADVSTRAIRHYHRIGILPEPGRTAGGYRDYQIAELVRVMHIRQFAEAGIPLRAVPAFQSERPCNASVASEIEAVSAEIRSRIEGLELQLQRLSVLGQRAATGQPLEELPSSILLALERSRRDAAGEPDIQALLDDERTLFELMALTATLPAALVQAYGRIAEDAEQRSAYLDVVRRFADLAGRDPALSAEDIRSLAAVLSADDVLQTLAVPQAMPRTADPDLLEAIVPDPAQREVIRLTVSGPDEPSHR